MKLSEILLAELDREVERSRRALEQVPDGKYDWKPHEKSMIFGYLADMVATIPSWVAMAITQDELDVAPVDGPKMKKPPNETSGALLKALDKSAADARSALEKTTEEHLLTSWRLLARGEVVIESPRHIMIQDTFNHWAHHRGQMTVYLRLMGAKIGRNVMLRCTQLFNLTGHPAISLPCGTTGQGLPVGLQLVGHEGRTADLLRVARRVEHLLSSH